MSSGWLPEHRQLFFQILEKGLTALTRLYQLEAEIGYFSQGVDRGGA